MNEWQSINLSPEVARTCSDIFVTVKYKQASMGGDGLFLRPWDNNWPAGLNKSVWKCYNCNNSWHTHHFRLPVAIDDGDPKIMWIVDGYYCYQEAFKLYVAGWVEYLK